jgi:hypothetical protein
MSDGFDKAKWERSLEGVHPQSNLNLTPYERELLRKDGPYSEWGFEFATGFAVVWIVAAVHGRIVTGVIGPNEVYRCTICGEATRPQERQKREQS